MLLDARSVALHLRVESIWVPLFNGSNNSLSRLVITWPILAVIAVASGAVLERVETLAVQLEAFALLTIARQTLLTKWALEKGSKARG